MDEILAVPQPETITCENCQSVSPADLKFCPKCSYPINGTEQDKSFFRGRITSRQALLRDTEKKIKSGRNTILILAGLVFLQGMILGFGADDFAGMIVNVIISLLYLILAAWATKNPFGAILTAGIVYVTLIVVNALVEPTTIMSGIILKIIIIGAFVKGIRSAHDAQTVMRELEKLNAGSN
jgi:hypothetical protein